MKETGTHLKTRHERRAPFGRPSWAKKKKKMKKLTQGNEFVACVELMTTFISFPISFSHFSFV